LNSQGRVTRLSVEKISFVLEHEIDFVFFFGRNGIVKPPKDPRGIIKRRNIR
jgi:hypothetical protein